jgi:hypothetical protein
METEYNRLLKNQDKDGTYHRKRFSIRRKDKSILETDNSQKFLDGDFDKDVDRIELQVSTENREIEVEISTSWWNDSNFSATSNDLDDIWVNGIMTKLAETFDSGKNLHQFWHSKKAYLVYFAISIILASIWYYLSIHYSTEPNEQLAIVNWLIWAFGTPFTFSMVFQWVFPKIETKQSRQRKFKKIILSITGVVGTLIIGIAASYLYDILK